MVQETRAKLTIHRRLRPLRLAVLVRAGDSVDFRAAVQMLTMRWGGLHSFILPVAGRGRGELKVYGKPLGAALKAIEPDFVVTGRVNSARLGIPDEHRRSIGDARSPGETGLGIDIMHVLRWRYERDFRYVLRDPIPLRSCRATGALSLFAAACFGDVPRGRRKQLARAFADLGGQVDTLKPETLVDAWTKSMTPLRLGASGVDVHRGAPQAFMLIKADDASDLADFWNLRALGWRVFPIPMEWARTLSNTVSGWIRRNHNPLRGLREVATQALIVCGNGVDKRTREEFLTRIDAPAQNYAATTDIPRVGSASPFGALVPPELSAREDELVVDVGSEGIQFPGLNPEFDVGYVGTEFTSATVISPKSWELPNLPTIFPRYAVDPDEVLGGFAQPGSRRIHSEGITVFSHGPQDSFFLQLPTGLKLFRGWLAPAWQINLSAAGKLTHRLLTAMGGPEYSAIWTKPSVVRLFDSINRTASRCMLHPEFVSRLKTELRSAEVANRILGQWVKRGVVALGLQVQCDKCGQRNWMGSIERFGTLHCERCLDSFDFPVLRPERDAKWAVRPLGPFSVEDHSHGAFAVAATLRCLGRLGVRWTTSWVPSVTLRSSSIEREVDFMMLRHNDIDRGGEPLLLLGECKTFNAFDEDDAAKMVQLGRAFPGAVLVFAKLGVDLDDNERRLLQGLVERVREPQSSNPVLILTATELSSDFGPVIAWRDGSEAERGFAGKFKSASLDVLNLCDATVQLRLGIPPSAFRLPDPPEGSRRRRASRARSSAARETPSR
jgi:hypothetical protein